MAKYKSEVVLTCNGKKVEDVLKTLRQMAADVKKEMDSLDPNIDATKIEALKKKFDLLNSAEASTIEANERLQHAIDNLATTSLQNLKKALGDGRRELQGLSEAQLAEADAIRKKMKIIGDEVRLLEGQYVKIEEGLKDINNQSNQWLDKAIKQQTELVNSLKKTDAEYANQVQRLKQLRDEETRRAEVERAAEKNRAAIALKKQAREAEHRANTGDYAGLSQNEIEAGKKAMVDYQKTLEFGSKRWQEYGEAIAKTEAQLSSFKQKQESMTVQQARDLITNKDATSSQLREARSTIATARENTPTSNTTQITEFDKMLQQIDDRLDAVNGKVKKTEISWQQMRKVMADPKGAIGEDIKRTMDAIQERIKKLPAGSQAVVNLRAEYAKLEKVLKGVEGELVDVDDVIRRMRTGEASIDELKKAYKQLEEEINHINTAEDEFIEKQKQLKGLKKQIDEVTGAANKQSSAWKTALQNLTAYVSMFSAFNLIKTKITDSIRDNYAYSDSLANIRKVSGLTSESIGKLSKDLAKIDTRTSQEEMASIAYTGAKLGLGKYGVEGLTQFTQAANQVNVALKEDMGEDALKNLSKMVEVMGLIPKMGVEKSMLATSSALFKLASTSTASADQVVEFAKRLTGMSRTAGITTDQLLALGSASDSMMLMPEVASTAFSKLIAQLQRAPGAIEESLQIPKGTIDDLFSAGKSMDAIVMILEKMKQKGNMNALDDVFKDLGSDGARLISVMVTMSKNVNMLKSHLYEANEAFEKATAVTDEYNIQQETAQAYLERANNLWQEAFVNPQGVNMVKALGKAWYDTSAAMTDSVSMIWLVKGAIGAMTATTWIFIKMLPTLIALLVSGGVLHAFATLKAEIGFFTKAVTMARKEWALLSTVMNTPVGWGAAAFAVAALVLNLYDFVKANDEAAASQKKISEYFVQGAVNAQEETRKLNEYIRALDGANVSQQTREKLIAKFNNEYGSYLEKLGIEVNNVNDLRDAYSRLNDEIRKKAFAQMRDQAMNDILTPLRTETHKKGFDIDQKLEKLGTGDIERTWLDSEYEKWKNGGLVGVNAYDPNSMGGYLYRQVMQNMYGANYNKKSGEAGKVNIGTAEKPKWVDELKDVNFADLKADIIEYVNDRIKETNAENAVNKEFDKELHGWQEFEVEVYGHLRDKDKTKGGSGHGGNPDKKEEQIAKDRANALIANIKAFYEEQQRKYIEWVAKQNEEEEVVSEGQQKVYLDHLETRMKTALGKARQSIATLDDGWKQFYEHMDEDVAVYDDETSKQLLESIGKSDVEALHKLFSKLSGDLSRENNRTLSENLGALLDQIFANGSKELREAAEKLLAHQRDIQKILNEHDYTGTVDRSTRSNLDQLGLLNPASGINADTQEGLQKMNDAFDKLTEKARKSIVELYNLNPESDQFQEQFLSFLSVAGEGFDFASLKASELKALYLELIKYTDSYTEAQKRQYERAKKIADQMWEVNKRNLANQKAMRDMQNEANLFGKRTNGWSNLGLGDLTADPEVELMKLKMQMAEDYYAFVRKNSQNQQLIDEADKARQEAQLAYVNQMATAMKERLSQMKALVNPVIDFGSAMGEALAQMRDDAEGANEAIKSALKSMLKSWGEMLINDLGTQMWKGINDAGAKRAAKKAQPDIEAAQKNADANAVQMNADLLGKDAAHPMYVQIVNGQPVDANGNPVAAPLTPNGTIVTNPDGTQGVTPSNNNSDNAQWNPYENNSNSVVFKNAGSEMGSAIADAATGNGGLGDAAAGIGMSAIDGLMNAQLKKKQKQQKDEQKEAKKHEKELVKTKEKGMKDQAKATDKGMGDIVDITDSGNDDQLKGTELAQKGITTAVDTALNTTLQAKEANNQATLQSDAARTEGEVTFSIAGAMAKCFEFLGPIAGPIAAAVVMATLMGLLQWALSSALGGSKKSGSDTKKGPNTKLVSGMLTYDSGNVRDLKPFFDKDGNMYWAEDNSDTANQGINLLTHPTATTINGQPSLVAEQGPELVIGRETTQAIMQNNPALLKALYQYDKHHSGRTAYDQGNLAPVLGSSAAEIAEGAVNTQGNLIADATASNVALLAAVNALLARLNEPISAKIDMYGRGNLYDSMTKANQFMKGKS